VFVSGKVSPRPNTVATNLSEGYYYTAAGLTDRAAEPTHIVADAMHALAGTLYTTTRETNFAAASFDISVPPSDCAARRIDIVAGTID